MVVLEDFQGNRKHANYSLFAVADEEHNYALELLGTYSGNAGNKWSTLFSGRLDNENVCLFR